VPDQKSNKKSKNSGSTPTPTAITPNVATANLSSYYRMCMPKGLRNEDCDICLDHPRHCDVHFETELVPVKLIMESGQHGFLHHDSIRRNVVYYSQIPKPLYLTYIAARVGRKA
jgi:hypothetical protein